MVDSQYQKGYIAGYRDGLKAATQENANIHFTEDMPNLPIDALPLSARAKNCLKHSGCSYAADIAKLSEQRIATMRNLGPKSAAEIAQWLDQQGIHYSAWCKYL